MNTQSRNLPTIVGTALVAVGVFVVGSSPVQDNLPRDTRWLQSLFRPLAWKLTPEGHDFDRYLAINLTPLVFVVATAGLLMLATRSFEQRDFAPLFFATWGAVVGAGATAGVVYALYSKFVLDFPSTYPGGSLPDDLLYFTTGVLPTAVFGGMFVALAVAVVSAVVSSNPAPDGFGANPYAGGPLDPSPPMTPIPPTPPPPTTTQPTVDPTIVSDPGDSQS